MACAAQRPATGTAQKCFSSPLCDVILASANRLPNGHQCRGGAEPSPQLPLCLVVCLFCACSSYFTLSTTFPGFVCVYHPDPKTCNRIRCQQAFCRLHSSFCWLHSASAPVSDLCVLLLPAHVGCWSLKDDFITQTSPPALLHGLFQNIGLLRP